MVALNAAMRRPMLVLLAVMSTTTTLAAGSNPKDDFASAWKGQAIVLKVLASWLIAVAVLGAILQFLPATPGYLADHLE